MGKWIMLDENLYANEDPTWKTRMLTLMKMKRNLEIAQTIDSVIEEYYSGLGLPVPQWKSNKDPEWWVRYLKSLGIDSNNP
tara:strand:- start:1116 stop:1358 length:243 start_codon:yes stop_codon:yes gene_type:complete